MVDRTSEDEMETTITRALTEAEAQSIAESRQAFERGEIDQVEVGPGVWKLKQVE